MPTETETASADPVAIAMNALISALKTAAVNGDFERTTGFLRKVQDMHTRWTGNQPAHTPRTKKDA